MSDLFLATSRNGAKFAVVFLPAMPTWRIRLKKARINHRPQQDFGKGETYFKTGDAINSKRLPNNIKKQAGTSDKM